MVFGFFHGQPGSVTRGCTLNSKKTLGTGRTAYSTRIVLRYYSDFGGIPRTSVVRRERGAANGELRISQLARRATTGCGRPSPGRSLAASLSESMVGPIEVARGSFRRSSNRILRPHGSWPCDPGMAKRLLPGNLETLVPASRWHSRHFRGRRQAFTLPGFLSRRSMPSSQRHRYPHWYCRAPRQWECVVLRIAPERFRLDRAEENGLPHDKHPRAGSRKPSFAMEIGSMTSVTYVARDGCVRAPTRARRKSYSSAALFCDVSCWARHDAIIHPSTAWRIPSLGID